MTIAGYSNVVYDSNSDIKFTDLHEEKFLEQLAHNLNDVFKNRFDEYVFVVYSCLYGKRGYPFFNSRTTGQKVILIIITEETGIIPDYLADDFFAVFKIHMQVAVFPKKNIFAFPLGCTKAVPQLPVIPINDRRYDIFFSGNLNNNRIAFFRELSIFKYIVPFDLLAYVMKRIYRFKKFVSQSFFLLSQKSSIVRFTEGFGKGFPPTEYARIIGESKIVLCPKGFVNSESFRHYEALRAGCIIVSEKLPDTFFYKNSPIIQVNNWKDGLNRIKKLLKNEEEMIRLQNETIAWWNSHCSEQATAKYMLECIISLNK